MDVASAGMHVGPAPVVDMSRSRAALLRPLGLRDVRLHDGFWATRHEMVRRVTLPAQYRLLEDAGNFDNFRRAAGTNGGAFRGKIFNDSDVYKWLDAASWVLATEDDPELAGLVDGAVSLVAAAQGGDGYLDTAFAGEQAEGRWTDLQWAHELYCAGHLMQAAVAHHRALGACTLLDVAIALADHIVATFGPDGREGTCGHPEVEMALVELARETGREVYLRQAQLFLDRRGRTPPLVGGQAYAQDHAPFLEQRSVVGHAVRALYLYSGATDIYAETGDTPLLETLGALWTDLHAHKVYVTGGVGARHQGESVGDDYELPNRRAYAETCAAIAHVMWAQRMLLVTSECRYADALETALYNGVLAGIALDGLSYFYENPLADRGRHRRQPWFECACCPPNVARLIASLGGYVYSVSDGALWVHQYVASAATAMLGDGQVVVEQRTRYPWHGDVEIEVQARESSVFTLMLRLPSWCPAPAVEINGEPMDAPLDVGAYAAILRTWRPGDVVRLSLPMPVQLMASHPFVLNNHRRVAVTRGPLVYCLEQADHPNVDVWNVATMPGASWDVVWRSDLLGGVMALHGTGLAAGAPPGDLYMPADIVPEYRRQVALTAIPYYTWANREAGPMVVWLPAL